MESDNKKIKLTIAENFVNKYNSTSFFEEQLRSSLLKDAILLSTAVMQNDFYRKNILFFKDGSIAICDDVKATVHLDT